MAVILAESPEAEAEPDALASPPALALPEASPEGALLAEPLALALELELPLADALDPEFEVALAHAENTTARAGTPSLREFFSAMLRNLGWRRRNLRLTWSIQKPST